MADYEFQRQEIPTKDVDFILVYETGQSGQNVLRSLNGHATTNSSETIAQFLTAIAKLGLELQEESEVVSAETTAKADRKIHYIKIHATNGFLAERAEMARMRVPFKEVDIKEITKISPPSYLLRLICPEVKAESRLNRLYYYKVRFLRQLLPVYRSQGWMLDVNGSLFSQTQRLELVWKALESLSFQVTRPYSKPKSTTIHDLLENGVLSAVFPIHDSDLDDTDVDSVGGTKARLALHNCWASFKQWRVLQPLDDIYSYFGTRVALYFAWLGFYTKTLCVPATLGVIATIYSAREFTNPDLNDYCDLEKAGNFTRCPLAEMDGEMWSYPRLHKCAYGLQYFWKVAKSAYKMGQIVSAHLHDKGLELISSQISFIKTVRELIDRGLESNQVN